MTLQRVFQIVLSLVLLAVVAVVEMTLDPDAWGWTLFVAGVIGSFVAAIAEEVVRRRRATADAL